MNQRVLDSQLISGLIEKTDADRLKWQETANVDQYSATLPSFFTVTISANTSTARLAAENLTHVILTIAGKDDELIMEREGRSRSNQPLDPELKALYHSIVASIERRSAKKKQEVLESILKL